MRLKRAEGQGNHGFKYIFILLSLWHMNHVHIYTHMSMYMNFLDIVRSWIAQKGQFQSRAALMDGEPRSYIQLP